MTKQEIFDKVKPIVMDILGREENEVKIDSKLEDLRADSLDTVELIMEIEKKFDQAIPDERMEKFTNIQSIVDYIFEHQPVNS